MLREEIRALRHATPRQLRNFGLSVGGVFCLLAVFFFIPKWQKHWFWWLLIPGVPLVALGLVAPRALKWANVVWMTAAMTLGAMISAVVLTLLFYLVVMPIGMAARLAGKDFLSRKLNVTGASYWILREATKRKRKSQHERQF